MVRGVRMLCPAWLLALAVLCAGGSEVRAQCWENARCRDLSTEENILECIQLCRSELTDETPVYPGESHLQPPSEPEQIDLLAHLSPVALAAPEQIEPESGPRHDHKRSYSMEHFRWGKPVGRKRRPIKVYTNGVEEESAETLPAEMRRELANNEVDYPQEEMPLNPLGKKDPPYKMTHFRWSVPPASKRYGGFMKSWDERAQKPLLTLFKNVMHKDQPRKDE
ncbi:proopiomelanocortin a precursor [Danio rerio]|uniref:Pro-opiomelanocortin protein n=1 Tax=Danio rerio TaxID=7955 RepID=Q7ZT18_DANRE|nr:proopiomelanocortin a precursor [Danio rerio]AAI33875.1 Proopiomelanocortin a [Danio rerio]AAN08915.1 pro-opiomelanocortin protein [Danio rerio]AAN60548.1 proopiomelanocortin [Danio rerio]AAO64394.1 proopiomelanocortin [Danio rerio]|eukprot:NP_852103.1 pro-opiomelanocortin precursor [Danio rerio]